MWYVIDFTERMDEWASMPEKPCIVSRDCPHVIKFSQNDVVFAHSTDFRPDLEDRAYSGNADIQKAIKGSFSWDDQRAREGLQNVLRFRESMRQTGDKPCEQPWLVIYSGDAKRLNEAQIKADVARRSLSGFPERKVYVHDEDLARPIKAHQLRKRIRKIADDLSTGKCAGKEVPLDLLPALALLCEAQKMALAGVLKLPSAADSPCHLLPDATWWLEPFKDCSDAAELTHALEDEWGGKLPVSLEQLASQLLPSKRPGKAFKASVMTGVPGGALLGEVQRDLSRRLGYA